jgi:A/G-specific adenine glycosylase
VNKAHKIQVCQQELLKWFETNKRDFPWRKESMSTYNYIISEVLLQRTKAETIAEFYPKFIARFPDWRRIDSTELTDLESILIPIGLYRQRAKRLKELSKRIIEIDGNLPIVKEELESIPFFGQYITNAVCLFVFKRPSPLLDVNMARVLERIFGQRKKADIRYDEYLQKLSYQYVNHPRSKELNWGILDFAALICKAKPLCSRCPMQLICKYYKLSSQDK